MKPLSSEAGRPIRIQFAWATADPNNAFVLIRKTKKSLMKIPYFHLPEIIVICGCF